VLVNGKAFTGGTIPYGSKVALVTGASTLTLRTDIGTMTASGAGVSAKFVLERRTDKGRPIVQLRLFGGDFSVCGKTSRKPSSGAKAPPPKTVRKLYGKRLSGPRSTRLLDGSLPPSQGRFRTVGRYAAATDGGRAFWMTADRCDGTLAQVRQGTVSVRDLVKKKTVVVRAGHSYLAKKS
jgi:hypothetical protein